MRHTFVPIIKFAELPRNETKSGNCGVLGRAFEEGLQADTYAHERFSRFNMFTHWFEEPSMGELFQAVTEVAYTRENKFLVHLSACCNMTKLP